MLHAPNEKLIPSVLPCSLPLSLIKNHSTANLKGTHTNTEDGIVFKSSGGDVHLYVLSPRGFKKPTLIVFAVVSPVAHLFSIPIFISPSKLLPLAVVEIWGWLLAASAALSAFECSPGVINQDCGSPGCRHQRHQFHCFIHPLLCLITILPHIKFCVWQGLVCKEGSECITGFCC